MLNRFRRLRKLWSITPEQEALLMAFNTPEEPSLTVFTPTPEGSAEMFVPMTPEEEAQWQREQEGWGEFLRRNLGITPKA